MTKYEAMHPTVVSEDNSSSGMLIISTINRTVCKSIYLKDKITNVIANDYILKYSATGAVIYITKYYSKIFNKFKI